MATLVSYGWEQPPEPPRGIDICSLTPCKVPAAQWVLCLLLSKHRAKEAHIGQPVPSQFSPNPCKLHNPSIESTRLSMNSLSMLLRKKNNKVPCAILKLYTFIEFVDCGSTSLDAKMHYFREFALKRHSIVY